MHYTTLQRSIPDPFSQLLGFDPFSATRRPPSNPAKTFAPRFDVRETEAAYLVEADLPGVPRESLEIELHQGVLTIRGSREQLVSGSEDLYHLSERLHGSFERSIRFPAKADPEGVSATLTSGVLRVSVAKKAEPQPRKIVLTPADIEPA